MLTSFCVSANITWEKREGMLVIKHSQPMVSANEAETMAGLRPDWLIESQDNSTRAPATQKPSDNQMVELLYGEARMAICPNRGGSISQFSWQGNDIFRPYSSGDLPTDLSSFPLVPFCNRIAGGRMQIGGVEYTLPAGPKEVDAQNAIHGLGWISAWSSRQLDARSIRLSLSHDGNKWPWAFVADQAITLNENGYTHRLSLQNTDTTPMPAGLGLHPYFPRNGAQLRTGAKGYWDAGAGLLPKQHVPLDSEPDWFGGEFFDHCFTGADDCLQIDWPTHRLRIHTSSNLPFTHVYVPRGEDFFCVEPVSHIPDAVNSPIGAAETGLTILEPGETMEMECRFVLEAIA